MRVRRAAFAALLLLSSGCAGEDEIRGRRMLLPDTGPDLPAVSLSLPEGVQVTERSLGPEARRYDFLLQGRPILGLYLGPSPDFTAADPAQVESETVGGLPAKTLVSHAQDRWSRDMLIQSRRPVFYYFSYRDLRPPELLVADHIIGSLHER